MYYVSVFVPVPHDAGFASGLFPCLPHNISVSGLFPFDIGFVCIGNIFRHWIHPESESALFPCSLWHRVHSYSASGLFPCSHRHRVHSRLNICLSRVGIGFVPMLTWVAGLFPMRHRVCSHAFIGVGFTPVGHRVLFACLLVAVLASPHEN